jgi:hypothetical protein
MGEARWFLEFKPNTVGGRLFFGYFLFGEAKESD